MNLFPMIQPELELKDASLPMYKEIAWDFEHNIPIYKNGSPKWITGKELYWFGLGKQLHVQKYSYPIYSWNYGCQLESLLDKQYRKN